MAVILEARGETEMGRRYVADVIYNRCIIEQQKHPEKAVDKVIQDVLTEPYQFSCFNDAVKLDDMLHFVAGSGINDMMKEEICAFVTLRYRALEGKIKNLIPVTEATHYHTTSVTPGWSFSDKMQYVEKVGNHVFYIEHEHGANVWPRLRKKKTVYRYFADKNSSEQSELELVREKIHQENNR